MKWFLLIFNVVISTAAAQPKRVIAGWPLPVRTTGYSVSRYYVWISNGHECDLPAPDFLKKIFNLSPNWEFGFGFLGLQCQPNPSRLQCTGALVTPSVVQTACHCLARFVDKGDQVGGRETILNSVWETKYRSYFGKNRVESMSWGVPSRSYYTHEKCSQNNWQIVIHDYGWIYMDDPIDKFRDDLTDVTYAPVYSIKEMVSMWRNVLTKSTVCLYIGFGEYRKSNEANQVKEASAILRHAWNYVMNYNECYWFLRWKAFGSEFNYTRDATWICTTSFTGNIEGPGHGDSGGPVTCDNQYVAVVSQGFPRVSFDMAIVFAVFQNAIEYRKAFIKAMAEDGNRGNNVPTLLPTGSIHETTPEPWPRF